MGSTYNLIVETLFKILTKQLETLTTQICSDNIKTKQRHKEFTMR
jgi:hypothetical protein